MFVFVYVADNFYKNSIMDCLTSLQLNTCDRKNEVVSLEYFPYTCGYIIGDYTLPKQGLVSIRNFQSWTLSWLIEGTGMDVAILRWGYAQPILVKAKNEMI